MGKLLWNLDVGKKNKATWTLSLNCTLFFGPIFMENLVHWKSGSSLFSYCWTCSVQHLFSELFTCKFHLCMYLSSFHIKTSFKLGSAYAPSNAASPGRAGRASVFRERVRLPTHWLSSSLCQRVRPARCRPAISKLMKELQELLACRPGVWTPSLLDKGCSR